MVGLVQAVGYNRRTVLHSLSPRARCALQSGNLTVTGVVARCRVHGPHASTRSAAMTTHVTCPMGEKRVWTFSDIANFFTCTEAAVERLRAEAGFPAPVLEIDGSPRWRSADVISWFEGLGGDINSAPAMAAGAGPTWPHPPVTPKPARRRASNGTPR